MTMDQPLSTEDLVRIVAVSRCVFGAYCDHDQCPCCAESDHVHEAAVAFTTLYPDFKQLKEAAHEYRARVARDPDQVARWATDGLPDYLLAALGIEA